MNAKLRDELLTRYKKQRNMYIEAGRDSSLWDPNLLKSDSAWLKLIVKEIGWPTVSHVGDDGAQAVWQLLQVADGDSQFQMYCLSLMKTLPAGEVRLCNIAYLEDRMRSRQGRPQLYGTQHGDSASVIADIDRLDSRRRAMGLISYQAEARQVESLNDDTAYL